MPTRIEVSYERINTDFDVAEALNRAQLTADTIEELGPAFANLPGFEVAAYRAAIAALQAAAAAPLPHLNALPALYHAIDDKTLPVVTLNKGALPMLTGITEGKAEAAIVTRLRQALAQPASSSTPTPPPPGPTTP